MTEELGTLRLLPEQLKQTQTTLIAKTQEFNVLTEQFKKEQTLRKKYKNELEDLKGAIRVYARVRPLAKYEKENITYPRN